MAELLVNVDVDDLAKGVAFYCEAFDLTVGRRFGDGGAELLGAGAAIYLLSKQPGSIATASTGQLRDYGRHWTPVHLDFVVEDIDAALKRAVRCGAIQETLVETSNWGKLALMADPFGNGFCLVQFLGRGYDEIANPRFGPSTR